MDRIRTRALGDPSDPKARVDPLHHGGPLIFFFFLQGNVFSSRGSQARHPHPFFLFWAMSSREGKIFYYGRSLYYWCFQDLRADPLPLGPFFQAMWGRYDCVFPYKRVGKH
ncbi:hypothetical protein E2C01_084385 [Portunus trituberculatus]|uniref:Uncharacterized protein n=1 Tax=Portunus trituberculatus TaxID=210409 RepID=A0A5B7J430_PORTR|nr:hypothetical protein [Portunus trituberculatus]